MLRTIVEAPEVTASLKRANKIYPRTWDAYEGLCWLLSRYELFGAKIVGASNVYFLHKQKGGGFGLPELTVIYSISIENIYVHAIKIG